MHRYSRWEDAMTVQTALLQHSRSEIGRKMLTEMGDSMDLQHGISSRMGSGWIAIVQEATLSRAEPVYMSHEVRSIIDHARHSFQPEPVRANDAFTDCGFVLLPEAIMLKDAVKNSNEFVPVRAVAWITLIDENDPETGSFWISYYTHIDEDIKMGRIAEESERTMAQAKQMFTPEVVQKLRSMGAGYSLVHVFQWSFGATPWDDDNNGMINCCPECNRVPLNHHDPECSKSGVIRDSDCELVFLEDAAERGKAQVQLIQTIWRIAAQVNRWRERAPRGIWRDANRKGVDRKDVTVITLRRDRDVREHEPTGRELSCQFVVRGHWRNQPYKDGVRQIWIAPYIKGPSDAPLKMTKRVWEFVR